MPPSSPIPSTLSEQIALWNLPLASLALISEKQVGLFQQGLNVFTLGDLLRCYPFRYEDRSQVLTIKQLHFGLESAQIQGVFTQLQMLGEGKSRRLAGTFQDQTGTVEVVWFQRIEYLKKAIQLHQPYYLYGRLNHFNGRTGYSHPEMEKVRPQAPLPFFEPIYPTTEGLKRAGLDSKGIQRLMRQVLSQYAPFLVEPFSPSMLAALQAIPLPEALKEIHQPQSRDTLEKARNRMKAEELFPMQFFLLRKKQTEKETGVGFPMPRLQFFNRFFHEALPFSLTNAQKRVLREIRQDLTSGKHMNRLVQGDVGSGKTVVALMAMLMAYDNDLQACLMAPTEILAQQHFQSIAKLLAPLDLEVALLTGSTPAKERRRIAAALGSGELGLLVGTHALIEETVRFRKLGLAIIDEQHRFGVAQRARLRLKNEDDCPPHVLVMSATPIPRTLAMALYSDLDVSLIDELPAGRKEIVTVHRTESQRLRVFGFLREEIRSGRQVYIVYPMIEESEVLDLNNLMEGFVSIQHAFPECHVSMVHGKMKPADKDFEMARFARNETQILVATTVIEVGVNIPNASVMVVENAERFGLTQLHQLRGRVGRGEYQSYCILMTGPKLSREGKQRIDILCSTTDGFAIAEADLKMRGPGDLMGTRQSGEVDLKLTNLAEDGQFVEGVRALAERLVAEDPDLKLPENQMLRLHLSAIFKGRANWNQIS